MNLPDLRINQLALFTFYFQPATPRNKAHKEQGILAKDLAREALRQLEGKNNTNKEKCESAHADLNRTVRLAQDLRGNGAQAKAIFACAAQGFWREYDLPAHLGSTQLQMGPRFHLKPLVQLLDAFPSLGIVLLDRHRARLFTLHLGELTEREGFFQPLSRRGRSDGFAGYDGGHAERRVADEARQHFKHVADSLKDFLEKGVFERWILGCQETHWPHFEPQLRLYVSQELLGRFSAEVAHISHEEIRSHAERIFAEAQDRRCRDALRETLDQARSDARGVTGLRRVLRSLESGEVQTLLLGDDYRAQAVECSNCGHLDAHLVSFCPACGHETRQVVDVAEAILPHVIRDHIELFYVKDNPEFDQVGNIAALLRFRSDQNGNVRLISEARPNSVTRREGTRGRYRGVAGG